MKTAGWAGIIAPSIAVVAAAAAAAAAAKVVLFTGYLAACAGWAGQARDNLQVRPLQPTLAPSQLAPTHPNTHPPALIHPIPPSPAHSPWNFFKLIYSSHQVPER